MKSLDRKDVLAEIGLNYSRDPSKASLFDSLEEAISFIVLSWPKDVGGTLALLVGTMQSHAEVIRPEVVASMIETSHSTDRKLAYFVWGALCKKISNKNCLPEWTTVAEKIQKEASGTGFSASLMRPMSIAIEFNGEDEDFKVFGLKSAVQQMTTVASHIRPVEWARAHLPLYAKRMGELKGAG